jgi:hypothetical protein
LCFKSLDVVKGFVRRANVIQMVSDMATSLWCDC